MHGCFGASPPQIPHLGMSITSSLSYNPVFVEAHEIEIGIEIEIVRGTDRIRATILHAWRCGAYGVMA
jgi:hypothetical protein